MSLSNTEKTAKDIRRKTRHNLSTKVHIVLEGLRGEIILSHATGQILRISATEHSPCPLSPRSGHCVCCSQTQRRIEHLAKKTKITYNTNAHIGQLKRQGTYHLTDTRPGRVEHVYSDKPKVTNSHGKEIWQDDSKIVRLLKNAEAHEKNKTDQTGEKRKKIKQMLTHLCPSGEFPLSYNGNVYICKLGGRHGLQFKNPAS